MPGLTAEARCMITASDIEEVMQIRSPNVSVAQRMTSSAEASSSSLAACVGEAAHALRILHVSVVGCVPVPVVAPVA